ncbi:hypothetical protein LTR08_002788 [Meristemomyces frigidus]|nr:hypothetical protein LTR08_002788 [Meristemomyces frigidus]
MADPQKATPTAPQNRKARRAAAHKSSTPTAPPTSAPKLRLAQPSRTPPKTKTLLDLYDEKKALLAAGQPFPPNSTSTSTSPPTSNSFDTAGNIFDVGLGDNDPLPPLAQAAFWALALSTLHFTLDVLVYHQYAQEILWPAIFRRTLLTLPTLFLTIALLRSATAERLGSIWHLKQLCYFVLAVATGCYTILVTNRYDYFAVMKRAPPLGTLWVWSVIELDLAWAVGSVGVNVGWSLWKGYTAI